MMVRKNHDGGRRPTESRVVLKIEDDIRRFLQVESIYSICQTEEYTNIKLGPEYMYLRYLHVHNIIDEHSKDQGSKSIYDFAWFT